jgi:MFS family permease
MMEDLELYIGFRYVCGPDPILAQPALTDMYDSRLWFWFSSSPSLTQGFAYSPNWQTLTGLRAVLGILEAGFFPGAVYLLSCWYSRCSSTDPHYYECASCR